MELNMKESLRSLVARKFTQAVQSQALTFTDSELTILRCNSGAPFQLRYCPSLAKKPQSDKSHLNNAPRRPKPDPFDKPSQDLLIAEIPRERPSHLLVLNKYPIIKNHFILATKTNQPQTGLLEGSDLGMSYACLSAWTKDQTTDGAGSLFAFFNSGDHSGASQPHRHLQFLPVEDMAEKSSAEWQLLTRSMTDPVPGDSRLVCDSRLPFVHFALPIEPSPSQQHLYDTYLALLRAAGQSTRRAMGKTGEADVVVDDNGRTVFSYNLAMTTDRMAIIPRRAEASRVPGLNESSVAMNGTILGGTLMVKMQPEWDSLRVEAANLDEVLVNVGFPQHPRSLTSL